MPIKEIGRKHGFSMESGLRFSALPPGLAAPVGLSAGGSAVR